MSREAPEPEDIAPIRSIWHKYFGRWPTDAEIQPAIQLFTSGADNYAIEDWAKRQVSPAIDTPMFNEYKATMESLMDQTLGYRLPTQTIYNWWLSGVTETQAVHAIRNSQAYKDMFHGKPAWMTESQYRGLREKQDLESGGLKRDWQAFYGRELTNDELDKIFYGGPGSETVRGEYARLQGIRTSRAAMRGKLQTADVKLTGLGPTQPLMAEGIQAGLGGSTSGASSNEKWLSYSDYLEGKVNPSYEETRWKAFRP